MSRLEIKRQNLYDLIDKYGLSNEIVIKCSMELDEEINIIQKEVNL